MRKNRFLPALFLLFLWAGGVAAQERGGCPVDLSHLVGADYSRFLQDRGGPLPAAYDLRTEGRVRPVKDVGPYNTGWAFAAMGSAESSYLTQKLGGTPDLSAMHLAWFAYMEPDKGFPILGDWGGIMERPRSADVLAQGGSNLRATAVLARWTGLVSEDDLPYKTVPDRPAAGYANRVVLQDVFFPGKQSVEVWKALIRDHGAIHANYEHKPSCYNETTHAYHDVFDYHGSGFPIYHVLVVGWDDDFPKGNFLRGSFSGSGPHEDGAWLARQNWGTIWGDQGYFWISYECLTLQGGAVYRVARPEPSARIYPVRRLRVVRQ